MGQILEEFGNVGLGTVTACEIWNGSAAGLQVFTKEANVPALTAGTLGPNGRRSSYLSVSG